jgi:hypothetical protein
MVCWLAGNDARGKVAYGVVKAMLFYNIIAAVLLVHARAGLGLYGPLFGWASRFTWAWAPGAWLDYSASDDPKNPSEKTTSKKIRNREPKFAVL